MINSMKKDSENLLFQKKIKSLEAKIKELEFNCSVNSNYHHFFTESLDLFCIANSTGYFTLVNPAFTTLLGYTEEELLNQPFMTFIQMMKKKQEMKLK